MSKNQGRLSGKVAVVTGASKGIGAAIARAYAAEGAKVVVNYATSKEGADRVVADITQKGGEAIAVQADVSSPADVKRLFSETKRAYDRLDILVNNAAVYKFEPLEAITVEELQRQFATNLYGPIFAAQEAAKLFGDKGGSILNIGTAATQVRLPGSIVYVATKSALDAVTRILSVELGARKIRVNTLNPGGVETEGYRALGEAGDQMKKAFIPRTPLGRFGQPDDIAKVAVFFASDDAAWVTGESVNASGGFS
jgi:3-oxoacyl-[acyl-carrier protein] reductase